jgi:predicted ATPase
VPGMRRTSPWSAHPFPSSVALVGRESELARCMSLLETVAGPSSSGATILLITAEAGIGKTRIVQEVLAHAHHANWQSLIGRCFEQHSRVPYFAFSEALDAWLSNAPPTTRAELAQHSPELALIAPQLGTTNPDSSQAEVQVRLFRAVTAFLRALATEQPVALVIEDLHWADSGTLGLLNFLAAHMADTRLLIVATCRDGDDADARALEATLAGLARERRLIEVVLRGLNQADTAELVRARAGNIDVSTEVAKFLHERSAGNPFFAEELVQACVEQHVAASIRVLTARKRAGH